MKGNCSHTDIYLAFDCKIARKCLSFVGLNLSFYVKALVKRLQPLLSLACTSKRNLQKCSHSRYLTLNFTLAFHFLFSHSFFTFFFPILFSHSFFHILFFTFQISDLQFHFLLAHSYWHEQAHVCILTT